MRVLANSLPKSGTHLLTRLLDLLGIPPANAHLSSSLLRMTSRNIFRNQVKSRRHWNNQKDVYGLSVDLDDECVKLRSDWLERYIQRMPSYCYFPGHLPYSLILENTLLELNLKILYIHRDPRDVLVSLCNHYLRYKNYPLHKVFVKQKNLESCLLLALHGYRWRPEPLASFYERLTRSLRWKDSTNICSVRFEDLVGSKGGGDDALQVEAVKKISNYLGFDNKKEIMAIAERTFDEKSETFYRGKIGQWREAFTSRVKSEYEKMCHEIGIDEGDF